MHTIDEAVHSIMTDLFNFPCIAAPAVPAEFIAGTAIHIMDLTDKNQFIRIGNVGNRHSQRSLAMKWIYDGPVGVMIASNMGRPGGSCSQPKPNEEFSFQQHPDATTQEESVLTFFHSLVAPARSNVNYLDQQMRYLFSTYGMKPPKGDKKTDFLINRTDGTTFNVRSSRDPRDYAREFGSTIKIQDPNKHYPPHVVYLSFVAGPNVTDPLKLPPKDTVHLEVPWLSDPWQARKTEKHKGVKQLDTQFRTISGPAYDDYQIFKLMTSAALVASLSKMAYLGYQRVIMAAPGSGLYAGRWKEQIQKGYYELCLNALRETYTTTPHRFVEVIVPKY
jgi:hypothetical protein